MPSNDNARYDKRRIIVAVGVVLWCAGAFYIVWRLTAAACCNVPI